MTTVFQARDLGAAQELLGRLFGGLRLTAVGERPTLRLARDDLGSVQLHRSTWSMRLKVEGPPLGAVAIGRIAGGVLHGRTDYRRGDVFIGAMPDEAYHARIEDTDTELAFLRPSLLAEVAGHHDLPIRFTGYEPVSVPAARVWERTYTFVRDMVAGTTSRDPLLTGCAARMLAAAAMAAFPNTARQHVAAADRRDAHPTTVRRALAYIDGNAQHDLSAAAIAAAAGVTVRSVQLAFRRHLGTTPMAYVRRARLDLAHRELLAADPATTTVSSIASRWGFPSHSSFSGHYRAAFGMAPSTTLRRR
jgi:AraC-like DNA-binding protein